MRLGMTLPVMEAGLDRQTLKQWAESIDRGPWDSLALGERIAFANPEFITTLAACAAWTQRVELVSTVAVVPLHSPVILAKQLATIDVLSNGRLTAGVGLGGRKEDYIAAGADYSHHTLAELQARVETMQAIWRGETLPHLPRPVDPRPVRGHIPVLAGALGPKAIARAASYASGLCGFSFTATAADAGKGFQLAREAWARAQRSAPPRLMTSFWYAIGEPEHARAQVNAHLRHYLTWLPRPTVEAMLPVTGFAGTLTALKERLAEMREAGADDVLLVPTTRDSAEPERLTALFG